MRLPLARLILTLCTVLGWSALSAAQAPVELATQAQAQVEAAQWRSDTRDAPPSEISALEAEEAEAEADAEPGSSHVPSVMQPVFGCAGSGTSGGQVLHAVTATYTARFAASAVLARAPPALRR